MRGAILAAVSAAMLVGLVPMNLSGQAPAERKLEISFDLQGRVTLVAQNVTVREILAEWSRAGGTHMVNAEKLGGAPVPLIQFDNRPEAEVMDSLLRSAAGYILAPRTVRTAGPSSLETVMILATSTPTASTAYSAPPPTQNLRTPGSPDDEIPPVTPVTGVPTSDQPEESKPAPNPTVNQPAPFVPIVPIVPVTPVTPPGRGRGGGS